MVLMQSQTSVKSISFYNDFFVFERLQKITYSCAIGINISCKSTHSCTTHSNLKRIRKPAQDFDIQNDAIRIHNRIEQYPDQILYTLIRKTYIENKQMHRNTKVANTGTKTFQRILRTLRYYTVCKGT